LRRLPLIRIVAVDPVLAILALFLLDAPLAFFSFLAAVAHDFLLTSDSHAKLFLALEGLPGELRPQKPPVPKRRAAQETFVRGSPRSSTRKVLYTSTRRDALKHAARPARLRVEREH
jgi:hypothetical protein